MGRPMVERLKGAGHSLKVYNRTRHGSERAVEPRKLSKPRSSSPCWPTTPRCARCGSTPGWPQRLPTGAIHLNMATVSMAHRARADRGPGQDAYVAAPVFGRPPVAAQGQLDIIAAGPKAALEKCEPLFKVLGKQTFVVGEEPEKANAVKIARNFLLATVIESLGEAFALVRKCGVAPARNSSTSWAAPRSARRLQELRQDDRRAGLDAGAVRHAARA